MANLSAIRGHHAALQNEQKRDVVAVFVGATSGIGLSTLETTVTLFPNPTIHIVGRSEAKFAPQRTKLASLNPNAKVHFFQGDVSLLADVDRACSAIARTETKVDYLFMSPGLIPLNGPQMTSEGLEACFVLSYYARIRFIQNLLPLLRRSPSPRVLSVLNAGHEKAILEDNLSLERNWAPMAVMNHTTTMMSLALEHLAQAHKDVVFVHSFPGLVQTEIFARLEAPAGSSFLWKFVVFVVSKGVTTLMWLRGQTPEESGERQAWHLTNESFEKGRLHQIDEHSEEYPGGGTKAFGDYKAKGLPEKVWEYTVKVIEKVVTTGHI